MQQKRQRCISLDGRLLFLARAKTSLVIMPTCMYTVLTILRVHHMILMNKHHRAANHSVQLREAGEDEGPELDRVRRVTEVNRQSAVTGECDRLVLCML